MANPSLTIRALGGVLIAAGLLPAAWAETDVRHFTVDLDGRPIGTHVFTVTREGEAVTVKSEARFDVKVLGVPLYRYRHDATEHWSGGCLTRLESQTDRNGKKLSADWTAEAGGGSTCEAAFAYWNPALLKRPRLLNPETGQFETAAVTGDATHQHLVAETVTVDLSYADGHWTGLESTTTDGRHLRYRVVEEHRP